MIVKEESFYCLSDISFCNIPQAKTGMDLFSEISNVAVSHSDLDHLDTGGKDGEETELADEVGENTGIGGEDRTTGKQTSGVEKDLQQVDLRVSELQTEVEPPVATEHRPHIALHPQKRPQSNADFLSVATREHEKEPCLSVLEHHSQVTMAGPVDKEVEGKSEIICNDTKTKVSLKMKHKPKEHSEDGQCAEKVAGQEVVASSKVRIMNSQS